MNGDSGVRWVAGVLGGATPLVWVLVAVVALVLIVAAFVLLNRTLNVIRKAIDKDGVEAGGHLVREFGQAGAALLKALGHRRRLPRWLRGQRARAPLSKAPKTIRQGTTGAATGAQDLVAPTPQN